MKTMSTDGKYYGDWQENHFPLRVAAILSCCLTPFWWSAACGGDDLFRDRVVKVFQKRCLHCHNDKEQKGDFSLQSAASAFADGHIEVGDADASRLVELITPEDGKSQMPKKSEPLSEAEIADIRNWIDRGAKWPHDLQIREPQVADLNWWSLPTRREHGCRTTLQRLVQCPGVTNAVVPLCHWRCQLLFQR